MPERRAVRIHRTEIPGVRSALFVTALVGLAFPLTSLAQPAGDSAMARSLSDLHQLVNQRRQAAGCEALRWHEATARVAEARARSAAEVESAELSDEDLARMRALGYVR